MWWSLKFEYKKFKVKKSIRSMLILFFLITTIFLVIGAINFSCYNKEEKKFIEYQNLNVGQYQNYEQFGTKGFDLLSGVSPVDIYFSMDMTNLLKSNVDTAEIVDINKSEKGKKQIGSKKFFQGYSDVFLILGTILLLIIGLKTIIIPDGCKLIRKTNQVIFLALSRLILYLSIIILMALVHFFSLSIIGIHFSPGELKVIAKFLLFAFLLMAGFYALGILTATFKKTRVIIYAISFLFTLNIFIPLAHDFFLTLALNKLPSPGDIALSKRKTLREFEESFVDKVKMLKDPSKADLLKLSRNESKKYLENDYIKNDQKEKSYIEAQQEIMGKSESISVFVPTLYYFNLTGESSTKGNKNQLYFFRQVLIIKKDFCWYYRERRFFSEPGAKIIPFLKDEQYVIKSKIEGPRHFGLALGILAFYVMVIFLAAMIRIKRISRQERLPDPKFESLPPGFYSENLLTEEEKEEKFDTQERTQGNQITLARKNDEFNELTGIKIETIIEYFARALELEVDTIEGFLTRFGVSMENELSPAPGMQKIVYAAIILAYPVKSIIINDFARNEGKTFHNRFKEILLEEIARGKTIIYYSSEGFSSETRKEAIEAYSLRKLELEALSLR
jgi:hypothetical protein